MAATGRGAGKAFLMYSEDDLDGQLRQRGVFNLDALRYVLYEAKGGLTVVGRGDPVDALRVDEALEGASGFQR